MAAAPDLHPQPEPVPEDTTATITEQPRHLGVAPDVSDTGPAPAGPPDTTADETSDTTSPRVGGVAGLKQRGDEAMTRALAAVEKATPPDIVYSDRPGLAKMWRHARYGQYAAGNHLTRAAGVTYSALALVYTGWAYLKAWLVERPTRAAVATVVLTVLALTPWGRTALGIALWMPHQLTELLTDL